MRIIHATDVYAPSSGGLERSVAALARRQLAEGHQVVILTPRVAGYPDTEEIEGVRIVRCRQTVSRFAHYQSPLRPFSAPVADPELARDVTRVIREFRPDLIHSHGPIVQSVLGPARRARVAVVAGVHDYSFVCAKRTLYRDGAVCPGPELRTCLTCAFHHFGAPGPVAVAALFTTAGRVRAADVRIAVSRSVAQWGSSPRRRTAGSVAVVPTFVDDSSLDAAQSAPRPDWVPSGPYIFSAVALSAVKGLGVLTDARRLLDQAGVTVPIVVAGIPQGISPEHLRANGILVRENAPHDEVLGAWRHATIGVHAATWAEPCSLAVIECLAAGTPLIGSNVGGTPEILSNGEAGVLVQPGDAAELARAVRALLADDERCAELSERGPLRARAFGLDVVWPSLEQLYRTAIERHAS